MNGTNCVSGVKGEMNDFNSDNLFADAECQLISARKTDEGRLSVTMNVEGKERSFVYPSLWLLHNCDCKECFDPVSLSHIKLISEVLRDKDQIQNVQIQDNVVYVTWKSGHTSPFSARWLWIRRFTEDGQRERIKTIHFKEHTMWPDTGLIVQKYNHQEILTDEGFERFGKALIENGLVVVTGLPDRGYTTEFIKEINGYVVSTMYGSVFNVVNEPIAPSLAHTNKRLEFHVDQPHLQNAPTIQMLQCINPATEGGGNILADSMKAALLLQKKFPKYYKILATQKLESADVISIKGQQPEYCANRHTAIVTDSEGNPDVLRWSNQQHSSYFNGSVEDNEMWWEAMDKFYELLCSRECTITYKSAKGEMLVFDNLRVMHAREGFSSTEQRRLEGNYTSWDCFNSRYRVAKIRMKLGLSDELVEYVPIY